MMRSREVRAAWIADCRDHSLGLCGCESALEKEEERAVRLSLITRETATEGDPKPQDADNNPTRQSTAICTAQYLTPPSLSLSLGEIMQTRLISNDSKNRTNVRWLVSAS